MNDALDKKLVEAFPRLYADRYKSVQKTCMGWGITCDNGWFKIIWKLSTRLQKCIDKLPRKDRKKYRAAQVKEKFGTLRFYMTDSTPEMQNAISKAEQASSVTCEVCGKPGKIRSDNTFGWLQCLCTKCRKAEAKKEKDAS